MPKKKSSSNKNINQVGGSHYKAAIEPIEFIEANKLSFAAGNVIKYVCRHDQKNGLEDLQKAASYLNILSESQYGCPAFPSDVSKDEEENIIRRTAKVSLQDNLSGLSETPEAMAVGMLSPRFKPEGSHGNIKIVVSIGRGGSWAAAQVAYMLDVDMIVCRNLDHLIREIAYLEIQGIEEKDILFMDDLVDTGKTYKKVINSLPRIAYCVLFAPSGYVDDSANGNLVVGCYINKPKDMYMPMPVSQYMDTVNRRTGRPGRSNV